MNRTDKPKLSSEQLVKKLEDKGVTFKYISQKDAEKFLQERNNFLRVAAYRKNYHKYENGINKGKYENLDFSYLQELSVIDMHFRYMVLKMCLDIEHALKVKLLADIEKDVNEDGYTVVDDFLNYNPHVVNSIEGTSASPFTSDLVAKYFTITKVTNPITGGQMHKITAFDCPAWVLLEILTFGDFIRFYEFYYNRIHMKTVPTSLINLTKSLRNACAHNNCVIADLTKGISHNTAYVSQRVSKIKSISKTKRLKKLSSRVVLEFVGLLCLYELTVSDKVKEHRISELKKLLRDRFPENKGFFKDNQLIISSYEFACKVTEGVFPGIEPRLP